MDNVIDITTGLPVEEEYIAPEDDIKGRRKAALEQLPQYRGEVQSKNTIRNLAKNGLADVGNIFWVTMDEQAFVVSEKDDKSVSIRPLDENASVSLGMTVYELNKKLVSQEPLFDWTNQDEVNNLRTQVFDFFNLTTGPKITGEIGESYYLLYGRELHYFTLFLVNRDVEPINFKIDFEAFIQTIKSAGDLISIDKSDVEEKALEIWIRTDNSKAELLYLMPFDSGIVAI